MQVNQEGTANIEDARRGRSDQELEDQWNSNMLGDRSLVNDSCDLGEMHTASACRAHPYPAIETTTIVSGYQTLLRRAFSIGNVEESSPLTLSITKLFFFATMR
jgi:hypothetical protein